MEEVLVKNTTGYIVRFGDDVSNEILQANWGKYRFVNEEVIVLLDTSVFPEIIFCSFKNSPAGKPLMMRIPDKNGKKRFLLI